MSNPYNILGVSENDSLAIIKRQYKQLALNMHPDKGGSEALFRLLQVSYAKILEETKLKQKDKLFNELKVEFDDYKSSQPIVMLNHDKSHFQKHFNEIFDNNKQSNPYDRGYGSTMVSNSGKREEINVDNKIKKFTIESFNDTFNKSESQNIKHLTKHVIPTPHTTSKHLTFTELGVDKIHDFSGENKNNRELHYTDYNVAYTTTKLIDPALVKKQEEYKNLKDIKRQREKPLEMS
jgi:DnaJ-class molecular chaperone